MLVNGCLQAQTSIGSGMRSLNVGYTTKNAANEGN
jgi:hypothetical protein